MAVDPRSTSGLDFLPMLRPRVALAILCVGAQILFLVGLEHPNEMMFDETHYVPAARNLFSGIAYGNVEHPLLGKWLIGLSMALFGDTPWGWRVLSTLAGTASVAALFGVAQALFRDTRASVAAALLAILNNLLFIQARIAMLDVFMGAFLLAGLWLMIEAWRHRGRGRAWRLACVGVMLGLAVGCKWAAAPYVALAAGVWLALGWRKGGAGALAGSFTIGALAVLVYLATFIPAFFVSANRLAPGDLLVHQLELLRLQTQALSPHPYESQWWQWPWIGRPIWYLYERVDGVMRGVLFLGNPAVMWGGLVAIAACLAGGLRRREPALLLIAGLFLFGWLIFAIIPKKIGFYYYYYIPALILPLALAAAFHRFCHGPRIGWLPPIFIGVAAALFANFYPVLSARPLGSDDAFKQWTWFDAWT